MKKLILHRFYYLDVYNVGFFALPSSPVWAWLYCCVLAGTLSSAPPSLAVCSFQIHFFVHFPIFLCFLLIYTLTGGLASRQAISLSLGEFAPCPGDIFEFLFDLPNKSHFFLFFFTKEGKILPQEKKSQISMLRVLEKIKERNIFLTFFSSQLNGKREKVQ